VIVATGTTHTRQVNYDTYIFQLRVIVMAIFVLAGFAGFVAHFDGSAEFQLDLDPSMTAWELVEKVLRAKAPPLLAPGMMLQLGLLGLAYVYSDPSYRMRVLRILSVLGFSLQKE